LSMVREFAGYGTFFGIKLFGDDFVGVGMLVSPAGAFVLLGILIAAVNFVINKNKEKKKANDKVPSAEQEKEVCEQ
ncbi:MAG: hypothetical protein J6S34_03490, partial [Clostridia bacterium]|nr:hypothetical protein [Clostridia bacterium]